MDASKYLPPDADTLDKRVQRLDKPGEHLWIMIATWHISNPEAANDADTIKFMDRENLLAFGGPMCFKCEKPYSRKMTKRRCLGSVTEVED